MYLGHDMFQLPEEMCIVRSIGNDTAGFPQIVENLENDNGHGKSWNSHGT